MTDVHIGEVFIGAGMSDDLSIGGGVRVTAPADLWLCGLIGMEEKLGSAYADGALVELYRLAFEREYATGVHVAGAAVFSGTVHATMATGFRQLFKVARGVRDLTPGGSAEGGNAPAPPAAPPPVEEAGASGALLGPSAVGMDEVDELAALEDIRYLFGDLDTTVDSGRAGNRAGVLDDLGSVAKFSATGEDVGDARALANRLQEGAGLSDLVEAEDMSAILHLDESPGTLDEARMVPDELLDGQWDNTNWVERGYIVPVEPVNQTALLDDLDNKLKRAQRDALDYELERAVAEAEALLHGGGDTFAPAVKERLDILEQKVSLYQTMGAAVAAGQDPVLFLDEAVRMAADAFDVSPARFAAMMETQAEVMEMFSNPVYGFALEDVGGLRSVLGVDDFDMASAVTELSARIEVYGFESIPGTTVVLDAFDRANGRALAQLEDLPDEWLARAGLTDGSGTLSADVRRAIEDDPESAYRILTKMEADARTRGLELFDQAARREALEMADYLAAVIAVLDRDAKSGFERALEAAEALRIADNIPLANDVDQRAMVRVIQERLAALDAKRATLDLNDANALAQLEAEHAFLTGALRRVEEGYDPGPRLREMVLIEHDRVIWRGGDASELANIEAAYRNVLEVLDDDPVSIVGMPSIDDLRPSGVGTSTGSPGEELTGHSDLSRYSSSLSGSSDDE